MNLARALVPGGSFLMGASGRLDNESPVHRVYVSAFEMALHPVTNREYQRFIDATSASPPPWLHDPSFADPDQPVVGVNWYEARAYCDWLSEQTGHALRLPTEAEREKAARGGRDGTLFPWGDEAGDGGHATLRGPLDGPDRVGATDANDFGLYHLADTVHEWCLDAYHAEFYRWSPERDPCALGSSRRASRGGSWRHQIVVTPCSARSSLPPELRYSDYGFRWVRDLT